MVGNSYGRHPNNKTTKRVSAPRYAQETIWIDTIGKFIGSQVRDFALPKHPANVGRLTIPQNLDCMSSSRSMRKYCNVQFFQPCSFVRMMITAALAAWYTPAEIQIHSSGEDSPDACRRIPVQPQHQRYDDAITQHRTVPAISGCSAKCLDSVEWSLILAVGRNV